MPFSIADLRNKTNAELIQIRDIQNGNIYLESEKIQANIILDERKTQNDKRMLLMTAIILILTIILVYAEFFHKAPSAPMSILTEQIQSQKLNPLEKKPTPQNKNDNKKILSHDSTSTKQK